MPEQTRVYRLRIRSADDSTDALTLTSVRGGTNPYLATPPQGDGQELDPLTGQLRLGSYNCLIADAATGTDGTGTIRVLTNILYDSAGRMQLLSRRAFFEVSTDNGSSWSAYYAGFVLAVRQVDAITYEVNVGDTRRVERNHRIFTYSNATERTLFPQRGCLLGGPIIGGWGAIADSGGWEYTVVSTTATNVIAPDNNLDLTQIVRLTFVAGYIPPDFSRKRNLGSINSNGTLANFAWKVLQEFAQPGPFRFSDPNPFGIVGYNTTWFPDLTARLEDTSGNTWEGVLVGFPTGSSVDIALPADVTAPADGLAVRLRVFQTEVSDKSPLYFDKHPVDVVTDLYDTVDIPYDATSAAAMKVTLGETLRYACRITEAATMQDWLEAAVFGPFGFAPRMNADGFYEFTLLRRALADAPSVTIDTDHVVQQDMPPIFDLDEGSVVTAFRFTWPVYSVNAQPPNSTEIPPPDNVVVGSVERIYENADTSTFSTREVRYDFAGVVHDADSALTNFTPFIEGIVREGFNRFGRGAPSGDLVVWRGSGSDTLYPGDECYVDVSHFPNLNYRIGESSVGPRIMQVVRRTEQPESVSYHLVDVGSDLQPVAPAVQISIAASALQPRTVAQFTVDNAAAINATGELTTAIEWSSSLTYTLERTTSGKLAAYAQTPEAGITEAFDTADWAHPGAGSLSLVSGALRYTSGTGDADVNIREVASENAVSNAAAVQLVFSGSVGGISLSGGPALRINASAPPNDSFLVCRGGSLGATNFGLQERINSVTVQTDFTAESPWVLPARVSIAVNADTARGYDFDTAEDYSLSGLTVAGTFAGWVRQGGAAGSTRTISEYYRTASEFISVSGLPSGWDVQILDAADNALATATESSGSAIVDMLALDWSLPRKVRVRDAFDVEVVTFEPDGGVWGGDVYEVSPPEGVPFTRYQPSEVPTDPVLLPPVTPGVVVAVRARTEMPARRASAWTDWTTVDLPDFDAPSGLTLSDITAQSVFAEWTNANTQDAIAVFLAPGSTAPADWTPYLVRVFPATSVQATLRGLAGGADYVVGVAHQDIGTGARSAVTWDTFTAATDAVQADPLEGFLVIPTDEDAQYQTGIALAIYPADASYAVEIQRADDLGTIADAITPIAFGPISSLYPINGNPFGTFTTIATVPGQTEVYVDVLPSDGVQRHYRARHIVDGLVPSAWSQTVSDTPGGVPDTVARPNLGPTLNLAVTPDPVAYIVDYTSNGAVFISIDGGAQAAAPASPVSIVRTAADQVYNFTATLNGQTISDTVVIPAYAVAPTVPSFATFNVTTTQTPDCGINWESTAGWTITNPDNATYFVRVVNASNVVYLGANLLDCADGTFTYVGQPGDPMFTGTFQFFPAKAQICLRATNAVVAETSLITDQVETGPPC